MKVDSVNSNLVTANLREKIDKSVSDNFATALLNRMGSEKDSYEETERKSVYQCENYNNLFLNATGKRF